MLPERESRPAGDTTEPAQNISTAIKNSSTLQLGPDVLRDLDALAEHLHGKFVVQTQTDGEKYRTRIYLTAKAAENAVRRGNARGRRVHVSLCQLLPVGVVVGLAGGS